MSIEGDTSNFRAPEERNVYGRSESPQSEAPAGRHVYRVSYLTPLKPQRGDMRVALGGCTINRGKHYSSHSNPDR